MRSLFLTAVIGLLLPCMVSAQELDFKTLLIKPYGFKDSNGKVVGVSVDIFTELQKRINASEPAAVLPLPPKRIPATLGKSNNVLIFPLTRNKSRGEFADWVYHVNDATSEFVSLKENELPQALNSLKTLSTASDVSVGVVRGSIFEKTLLAGKINPSLLSYADSADQNFMKLLSKRVDVMFTSRSIVRGLLKSPKFKDKVDNITIGDVIMKAQIYIAGSKNFDANLFEKVMQNLNAMQADGTMDTIREKYSLIKPEGLEGAKALDS